MLNFLVAFGVEHDTNGPGSLSIHAALLCCTQFTVSLRIKNCRCALSLSQNSQVIIDHGLDLLFWLLVIQSLKVDKAMAHLSVISAPRRLQLDLYIVHHDNFFGRHSLLKKRILCILEILLVLWQVSETHRIVLLLHHRVCMV